MKTFLKKLMQKISACLITTALALIFLSAIGLFYGGTMLCIATVFEIFGVCMVIQLALWLLQNREIPNILAEIFCRCTLVIGIVLAGGFLFHWLDNLPLWLLAVMAFVIYFLDYIIEMGNVKSEIKLINSLTKSENMNCYSPSRLS